MVCLWRGLVRKITVNEMDDYKYSGILTTLTIVFSIVFGIYLAIFKMEESKRKNICMESYGTQEHQVINNVLYCRQEFKNNISWARSKVQ